MFQEYNDMVSLEEMCEMLKIGKSKAYGLLRSGKVDGFKEGRIWMIPKQRIVDYINRHDRRAG